MHERVLDEVNRHAFTIQDKTAKDRSKGWQPRTGEPAASRRREALPEPHLERW
jgi:hypothetical protein